MTFLASDPAPDPEELYREALALGLDREDLVVRRILVEKMRLVLKHPAGGEEAPGEAELAAYLERHRTRFTEGARVSFSHVFLSADRRGENVAADARRLLAEFVAGAATAERAGELGDPFPLDHRVGLRTRREIEALFGPAFAARTFELAPGSWTGPVRSAYGSHLVWIHEQIPARTASLSAVRNQVLNAILAERREQRFEDGLRHLREFYEIRIGDAARVAGGARS